MMYEYYEVSDMFKYRVRPYVLSVMYHRGSKLPRPRSPEQLLEVCKKLHIIRAVNDMLPFHLVDLVKILKVIKVAVVEEKNWGLLCNKLYVEDEGLGVEWCDTLSMIEGLDKTRYLTEAGEQLIII